MTKIHNNTLFFGNYVDADLKLIDLQDYLKDINKFIKRKKRYKERKLKDSILKDVALNMFSESFSSILFESVLISAWVFMESEFKGYCNAMQSAKNIELRYSDLIGSAIERFKNYSLKVVKLDFRLEDDNWEDLKAISEIRNSLIHGVVERKPLIDKFSKRNKLPGLLSGDVIILNEDNLKIIITICRLFIERIYAVALETFPGQYGPKNRA
jgi:hypothetical protein